MVTLVEPTNVQKIEFNVTTTEGPSCVTIDVAPCQSP